MNGLRTLLAIAVLAFALLSAPGVLRADDEIDVRIANVDDSKFPLIDVVFTADLGGIPIPGLASADVAATASGQPANVISIEPVTGASIPLTMVVAFDLSGSMLGEPLARARDAATSLVAGLTPADEIAILTFADEVLVPQPRTTDKAASLATLAALQAVGNTALYDATASAAALANESPMFRRVVVLISDGEDFGGRSALSREQALSAAEEARVPYYVIGLGAEIDRDFLEAIAARTGGRFFAAPQPADLPAISASLENLLRSQYVATLEAAPDSGSDAIPQLSLRIQRPEGSGAATATYRSQRPAQEPTSVPATPTLAPATPEPTPVATATSAPVPVFTTTEEDGGGNSVPLLPFVAVGALVLMVPAALVFLRRRRSRVSSAPPDDSEPTGTHIPLPGPIAYRNGSATPQPRYLVIMGPGTSRVVELGHLPATIGAAESCVVPLDPLPGVAGEHLRVWWRDGKHMLHHVGKGAVTSVNGQQVEWASLRLGDTIAIGPYTLAYHETDPSSAATAAES